MKAGLRSPGVPLQSVAWAILLRAAIWAYPALIALLSRVFSSADGARLLALRRGWSVAEVLSTRPELMSPVSDLLRVREALHLASVGLDVYGSNWIHESPLVLVLFKASEYLFGFLGGYVHEKVLAVTLEALTWLGVWQCISEGSVSKRGYFKWILFNPLAVMCCVGCSPSLVPVLLIVWSFRCLRSCCASRSAAPGGLAAVLPADWSFLLACLLVGAAGSVYVHWWWLFVPLVLAFVRRRGLALPGSAMCAAACLCVCLVAAVAALGLQFGMYAAALRPVLRHVYLRPMLSLSEHVPSFSLWWYILLEVFGDARGLFVRLAHVLGGPFFVVPLCARLGEQPLTAFVLVAAVVSVLKVYLTVGDLVGFCTVIVLQFDLIEKCRFRFLAVYLVLFGTVSGFLQYYFWVWQSTANANFYWGMGFALHGGVLGVLYEYVWRALQAGEKVKQD